MAKPEDDSEPFLSRWARRKRDAGREADFSTERAGQSQDVAVDGEGQIGEAAGRGDPHGDGKEADAFDLDKLPKVDELTGQTDFSVFLDRRVPAALRNAALSRMWSLDPTIRDFIEVAENQWNWNVPGGAPFYEVIEPGTDLGVAFADATSAISRTLSGATSDAVAAVPEEALPVADVEKSESAVASGQPAAVQHENAVDGPALQTGAAMESPACMDQVSVEMGYAAPQQVLDGSRRRHGGALPI